MPKAAALKTINYSNSTKMGLLFKRHK